MEEFFKNISRLDKETFFALGNLADSSSLISSWAHWFAIYGIVVAILSLIYLVAKDRIHALFTAVLAAIFSSFIYCLLYLIWQSPESLITYASEFSRVSAGLEDLRFPSGQIYLSAAITSAVFLRGHKKLGGFLSVITALIFFSKIIIGAIYPSGAIISLIIGLIAGILAYWFMEYFEDFWRNHSA